MRGLDWRRRSEVVGDEMIPAVEQRRDDLSAGVERVGDEKGWAFDGSDNGEPQLDKLVEQAVFRALANLRGRWDFARQLLEPPASDPTLAIRSVPSVPDLVFSQSPVIDFPKR